MLPENVYQVHNSICPQADAKKSEYQAKFWVASINVVCAAAYCKISHIAYPRYDHRQNEPGDRCKDSWDVLFSENKRAYREGKGHYEYEAY